MLACDRSPALKELGTVTGDQPVVDGLSRQNPCGDADVGGSAR